MADVYGATAQPVAGRGSANFSFYLILAFAFFCPATAWTFAKKTLSYADLALILAMFSVALAGLTGKLRITVPLIPVAVSAGLLAVASSTASITGDPSGILDCLKLIFAITVAPLICAWSTQERFKERTTALLTAWMLGAVLSALVGVLSRHGISLLGLFDSRAGSGGRAMGLTYASTSLAYCSTLALTSCAVLFMQGNLMRRLLALGSAGILLYAIYLSGSRISVAAAAVMALPFLWQLLTRSSDVRGQIVLVTGSFFLLLFAVLVISGELALGDTNSAIARLLGQSSSVKHSDLVRAQIHDHAWQEFYSSPFIGAGFQNIRIAHSYTLQLLHSAGVIGLALFLAWLAWLCSLMLQVRTHAKKDLETGNPSILWAALIALLLGWFIHGLTQTFITDRNGYFWVTMLLALWFEQRHDSRSSQVTH